MEPSGKVMDKIAFQGQDLCFSCFAENASQDRQIESNNVRVKKTLLGIVLSIAINHIDWL